uniref:Uncharacterized protein n=1 Tax=Haemonchus contortus TaxID=6289 RepID=A0A7I4YIH8_HAECO
MDTDKKEELVRRQKARERSSNLWKKSQIIWLIVSFSIIKLVHQFSLLCGTRRRRIGRPVHSRRQELRGKSRNLHGVTEAFRIPTQPFARYRAKLLSFNKRRRS